MSPDVMVYLGPFNPGAAAVSIPILCAAIGTFYKLTVERVGLSLVRAEDIDPQGGRLPPPLAH